MEKLMAGWLNPYANAPSGCLETFLQFYRLNVRFGSLADICSATCHVRFTPNSDRKSGQPQTVMSASPPIADMCSATGHVCFGPIADIAPKLLDHLIREKQE